MNSSLHFVNGISKLHNYYYFFLMSPTIPAPCTLPASAGCCPPQQCSCPCAEGHLLMVLTTRGSAPSTEGKQPPGPPTSSWVKERKLKPSHSSCSSQRRQGQGTALRCVCYRAQPEIQSWKLMQLQAKAPPLSAEKSASSSPARIRVAEEKPVRG